MRGVSTFKPGPDGEPQLQQVLSDPCGNEGVNRGGDYTPAELEFMRTMDRFKKKYHRPFPTWRMVFWVLRSLGYRKAEALDQGEKLIDVRPDHVAGG